MVAVRSTSAAARVMRLNIQRGLLAKMQTIEAYEIFARYFFSPGHMASSFHQVLSSRAGSDTVEEWRWYLGCEQMRIDYVIFR